MKNFLVCENNFYCDEAKSFWCEINQNLKPPRNSEERKEKEIIDNLYLQIKKNPEAVELLIGLMSHFHARFFKLQHFLDNLSDQK